MFFKCYHQYCWTKLKRVKNSAVVFNLSLFCRLLSCAEYFCRFYTTKRQKNNLRYQDTVLTWVSNNWAKAKSAFHKVSIWWNIFVKLFKVKGTQYIGWPVITKSTASGIQNSANCFCPQHVLSFLFNDLWNISFHGQIWSYRWSLHCRSDTTHITLSKLE